MDGWMDGRLMGVGWSGWYFRVWRIPCGNCGCSIDSEIMYWELALQKYVEVERYMILDLIVDLFKVAGRQCAICFFYMHLFFIYFDFLYARYCLQLGTGVACIRYALEVWCDAVFLEHFCQQNHCKQVVRISGCIFHSFLPWQVLDVLLGKSGCVVWAGMACCCFCSVSMSCPCEKCVKRQHRNGMLAGV